MANLAHGSLTICDESLGDTYSRVSSSIPDAVYQSIGFPNTAGRELKIVAVQTTDASALAITYRCRLYRSSRSTMQTMLNSIKTQRTTTTTALGTVTATDGSFSSMLIAEATHGPIRPLSDGRVFCELQITFSQFGVS